VGEPGTLVDPRLAKALSHPLRAHILAILNDRVASPNEIAEHLEERLPNVSYHVRALLDLECIELVKTTQRRGAVEHYYRAIQRPFFSDRDWKRLPQSGRQAVSDVGLQLVWKDVSQAVRAGTFDARTDRYLARSPLVLDEQGWNELNAHLGDVLDAAMRIAAESADRLAKADGRGFPTKLVLMHFESPGASASSGGRSAGSSSQRRAKRSRG
jgi:DNA-binding transcriptional ArsR family regulator